jgi:acylphosphatase
MSRSVKIIVSGKVQGVCFRANAKKQAEKLSVQGWVKNLPSGEVEINATAMDSAIAQLIAWCYKGPAFAKVERVTVTEWVNNEPIAGFEIVKD